MERKLERRDALQSVGNFGVGSDIEFSRFSDFVFRHFTFILSNRLEDYGVISLT